MTWLGIALTLLPVAIFGYAYAGYPLLLRAMARRHPPPPTPRDPVEWPMVTLTLPVYNESATIREAVESLLALDYPKDRLHILVISDASTDGTDEIVREYESLGVELLRLPQRGGKTAAENAAGSRLKGEIVVNTDATTRIPPGSLRSLVRAFGDSTVGVASGRDVSVGVGDATREANAAESGYVGYEMHVRQLETRVGSIVGASGCFYGIRASLYEPSFPEGLSRDFASALLAREGGYRAVSVDEAVCFVPRARSLQAEFRRKIRTMARGLDTLWYKRHLLNPARHGVFAWMLLSHKLCRWLVYVAFPLSLMGLAILTVQYPVLLALLAVGAVMIALGIIGMRWPEGRHVPRIFALPGFILAANLAGLLAWVKAMRGERLAVWEPTRRTA